MNILTHKTKNEGVVVYVVVMVVVVVFGLWRPCESLLKLTFLLNAT